MFYGALFLIGLFFMVAVFLIMPIGLIELPYNFIKNKDKSNYRRLANTCWGLSATYIVATYVWLINLPGGSFSGFFLPPLLIIPGALCIMYLYFLFKSKKSELECEVCGKRTEINWGDSEHIFCEDHRSTSRIKGDYSL